MSERAPAKPSPAAGLFVGRKTELLEAREEFLAGRNLLVTGPYGIGRTAFLRRLSGLMADERSFLFLDGSSGGALILRDLAKSLFPGDGIWRPNQARLSMAGDRKLIRSRHPPGPSLILVLDDLNKATHQKCALLRELVALPWLQVAAVMDDRTPAPESARLRLALFPASHLVLGRLKPSETRAFFRMFGERQGRSWSVDQIKGSAQASRGYPLGMWQMALGVRNADPLEFEGGRG